MLLDKLGIGDRIALSPEQLVEAALAARWCPSMPCPAPASSVPASMASSGLRSSALIPAPAFVEGQGLLHRDHRLSDPAVYAGEQCSGDRAGTGGVTKLTSKAIKLRRCEHRA
jgi:hypothetical protein